MDEETKNTGESFSRWPTGFEAGPEASFCHCWHLILIVCSVYHTYTYVCERASLVAQTVKNLPAVQET